MDTIVVNNSVERTHEQQNSTKNKDSPLKIHSKDEAETNESQDQSKTGLHNATIPRNEMSKNSVMFRIENLL